MIADSKAFIRLFHVALAGLILQITVPVRLAAQSYTVLPASGSISWGSLAVGMPSQGSQVSVTNNGKTPLTITSFSISPPEFQLIDGYAPTTVNPGSSMAYQINFIPDAVQTFNGNVTLTIQGVSTPIVVSLTGTGKKTLAAASVSPSALVFSQPVGSTSASQTISVTNTGKSSMTLNAVTINPPFTVNGITQPVVMKAGATLTFPVSFFASAPITYNGTLYFSFDNVQAKGVNLVGTGVTPSALVVSSYPSLPLATQSSAYLASLQGTSGTGGLTWSLASGSSLPDGLSLSSSGTITGTLASTVGIGSYPFTVQVQDSSVPPATATAQLTLAVSARTGAVCNNITMNVPNTTTPIIPLTDLGTGFYQGSQGGLYAGGSNQRPASNDADGLAYANAIQPLDANGKPSPTGKYALIAIGMSAAHTDFDGFLSAANADPLTNPNLVIVNAAMNGVLGSRYATPTDSVWNSVFNYILPQKGVTANQVVAAWVSESDALSSGTYPSDMTTLTGELEGIAQELHTKFPNLKLAYFSSRFYTGYSNGILHPANDEPYAFESGFAVKNTIQDQLGGDPRLNYNPSNGPVRAPWITWGPYYWANGLSARSDGLVFTCQDSKGDGNHPSVTYGKQKDAYILLNFFKTDDTTTPWFLAH